VRPTEFWCAECRANSFWVIAQQLARIVGVSRRTIYRWLERGRVHNRQLPSGVRLLCVCGACGQRGRGSCDGCETKILCQGVPKCDTLVIAPPMKTTHIPDAIPMVPSRRARSTTVLGAGSERWPT
jgi:hypothetical protein